MYDKPFLLFRVKKIIWIASNKPTIMHFKNNQTTYRKSRELDPYRKRKQGILNATDNRC
jgi:hypothetical protein